ncbi:hypothetical protein F5Y08DRAFT_231794 [Xylaria arbuscula]|nr:hypothetical protein F5Y08DRAFT_231794 [Xylaria arbuscula]
MAPHRNPYDIMPGGTVLGGLCPKGGEVKRWELGKLVIRTGQAINMVNLPTGRGHNDLNENHSSPKGAQVPGRGRGRGGLERPSKPILTVKSKTSQSEITVDENHGRLTPPPRSLANKTNPGKTTMVQPQELHLVLTPKTIKASLTPDEDTKVSQNGLPVRNSPSLDASWVPPHLRKSNGTHSTVSPSPTISRPSSPRSNGFKPDNIISTRCEEPHKITSLDAHEIFFQGNLQVRDPETNNLVKARIVIYKLLDPPICVWELTIETQKMIRGDIRDLLPVLQTGSMSFLRRYRKGSLVRSHQLQFPNIGEAEEFQKEANFRRGQYANSIETLYDETSMERSKAEHIADCKPEVSLTHKVEKEPAGDFTATAGRVSWTCQSGVLRGANTNTPAERQGQTKPAFETVSVAQPAQKNAVPRTNTPSLFVSNTPRPKTPPRPAAVNHKRSGSGWSDSKDLISFSPSPSTRSRHSDDLAGLELEPSVATAAQTSSGLSSGKQEDHSRTRRLDSLQKSLKDLLNLEIRTVRHPSPESLEVIDKISGDYDRLIQRSMVLSLRLNRPYQEMVSAVALSHLLEREEFMSLSLDDQKECLSVVCCRVCHGDATIVRSAEQIRALRTGEEPYPDAVKELNALILRHRRGVPISQPAYRPQDTKAANGHRRSSTVDTMTMLASQLESLNMK